MSEDSFLEKDQFLEVRYNYSESEHANFLVGSTNFLVLDCQYNLANNMKLDTLQMKTNKFVNKIIKNLRIDLGLDVVEGENYFKWVNRTLQCSQEYIEQKEFELMSKWLFCEESVKDQLCHKKYYLAWVTMLYVIILIKSFSII